MVVGKSGCAGAPRRNQRDGISPIAVCCAGIGIRRSPRNCPFLEVATIVLILNCDGFSLGEKRQKNININIVIR
jgi:hypothetical protein